MSKLDKNTASIGFEQKIWEAADTLRGNLNAAEYEGVVLGLIFLKYISDKFEAKYQELLADEYADAEDKDEYPHNANVVRSQLRYKPICLQPNYIAADLVCQDAPDKFDTKNKKEIFV